jgi:hypothetical protein
MPAKAVNLSAEVKKLLADKPDNDVLNVGPDQYIVKPKKKSWEFVSKEAAARWEYEISVKELVVKLPGHRIDTPVVAALWLTENFGEIDWGPAKAFPVDGLGREVDVPQKPFTIPDTKITMQIDFSSPKAPQLQFTFRGIDRHIVDFILKGIKDKWRERSLFKGKSLRLDGGSLTFFNPFESAREQLIFDEFTIRELESCILSKLTRRDEMRKRGIALRTGVLLHGPIGCGKTALALEMARLCEENELTFIYCKTAKSYEYLLNIVEQYKNVIILLEDVDQIIGGGPEYVDKLINWLDAVDSKKMDTLFAFTTNHPERLAQFMPKLLRAGRLDYVIKLDKPAARERERLLRSHMGCLIDGPFEEAISQTEGCNPAGIKNVCQRALQYAAVEGEDTKEEIKSGHVVQAARSFKNYLTTIESFNEPLPDATVDVKLRSLVSEEVGKVVNGSG